MVFNIDSDFEIFKPLLLKRPEIAPEALKQDLVRYFLPYIEKLFKLKEQKGGSDGLIVGTSAIQGTGKTTQGEILEILITHLGKTSESLSIDDHYMTHDELNKLREQDPRYIRRGVTHDIPLAIQNLKDLKFMKDEDTVEIPIYDKGAFEGDGDRTGFRKVTEKPDFIFYDGWMLGARTVQDESIFNSGLPALDSPEHIDFAKMINKKLEEYHELWELIDFMTVLYVQDYEMSLKWRDQAEEKLRKEGKGMTPNQIREFVYYFWRSVHPAIQIKNLAFDSDHTNQVVVINDDHSIKEVLTPDQTKANYS